jgi:FAD/FMN-containing dehydrogenase
MSFSVSEPIAHQATPAGVLVNDVHSQLNPTFVEQVVRPGSVEQLQATVALAARSGRKVSICGGRHSMGGQQFGAGTVLIDMRDLSAIQHLDQDYGVVDVQAGVQWPALIDGLMERQVGSAHPWGIAQKQTGADRLTIGGALSANVHGRGLTMTPIVGDVVSFDLIDARGMRRQCSRTGNADLFALAIGGYGLFGVIASVRLRLARRVKLQRRVRVMDSGELTAAFGEAIAAGARYGDFQFATDTWSNDFLRRGVFVCYYPVPDDTPAPASAAALTDAQWRALHWLSHDDKRTAFRLYAAHYLATDGQTYWSDTHQLAAYVDDYHEALDRRAASAHKRTEMITEVYVPREQLARFLEEVRQDFRSHGESLIYGTIRLIERDTETFLPWASDRWACIVFNVCVEHTTVGLDRAASAFRQLIDTASACGGTYYLAYHRWATRAQIEACHPRIREWVRMKQLFDPECRFDSDWYRHLVAALEE